MGLGFRVRDCGGQGGAAVPAGAPVVRDCGANDVAFSSHGVLLTAQTLIQIAIYECGNQKVSKMQRGNQKVSKISIGIVVAVWLSGVDHTSGLWAMSSSVFSRDKAEEHM
ncbi:hypothetical protein ACLB2K_009732 [Fragaria x ananassa]